jgi:hypothetical protein
MTAAIRTLTRSAEALRVPSALYCGLLMFAIKMSLITLGYHATLRWIRQRVRSIPARELINTNSIQAVEHAVAVAGAFYPGRALCLEQSLTLYYLLRRQGIGARYHQGVRSHPFEAHAWVEFRGEVINDVAERPRLFARLPDQLP